VVAEVVDVLESSYRVERPRVAECRSLGIDRVATVRRIEPA